jgi:hypothetical protein
MKARASSKSNTAPKPPPVPTRPAATTGPRPDHHRSQAGDRFADAGAEQGIAAVHAAGGTTAGSEQLCWAGYDRGGQGAGGYSRQDLRTSCVSRPTSPQYPPKASHRIRRAQHQAVFRKSSGNSRLVGVHSVTRRDRALWGFSWMILPQRGSAGDCSGAGCRALRTRHRTRPLRPGLRRSGIRRMAGRLTRPPAGCNGRRDRRRSRVRAQLPPDPPRQQLPRRRRPRPQGIGCAGWAGVVNLIIPFAPQDCIRPASNGSAAAGNRGMDHGTLPN